VKGSKGKGKGRRKGKEREGRGFEGPPFCVGIGLHEGLSGTVNSINFD